MLIIRRSCCPSLVIIAIFCSLLLIVPTFLFVVERPDDFRSVDSVQLHAQHLPMVAVGDVIMPKLGNATVKAELGRASWKLLHTMAQRYPDKPTEDQRTAFASFLHLFSRLYPCGECAAHFQALLEQYPPQTSSKTVASMYLCSLHNMVNESLDKEEFDCSMLEGLYDCGCGEEPVSSTEVKTADLFAQFVGEDTGKLDPLTGEKLVPG